MKPKIQILYLPINGISPSGSNARTHSRQQIRQIARSIEAFGFINPVLVDEHRGVVAGHGRLLAAKDLGLKVIPTILVDHLSLEQKRAYMLADNKIAANAGWDAQLLRVELEFLSSVNIDVELTGFAMPEIDIALGIASGEEPEPAIPPPPRSEQVVVRVGDVWQVGVHRLICGDVREATSLDRLMAGKPGQMVFTDPPYNVPIDGHATGKGRFRHREFQMASGEMSKDQFFEFLTDSLSQLGIASADGALVYVCMDWRHMGALLAAGEKIFQQLINVCVWNKTSGGMGSLYRSKHELVFVFRKGRAGHRNNVQLGRFGRNRTNVWDYPGVNTLGAGRDEALAIHPTVKPVRMVADAILDVTKRGDLILDGFTGSGSTLLAAEQTGRVFRGIEIDPAYVEVAIRRWEQTTGEHAFEMASGKTLAQLARKRSKRLAGER